MDFDHARALDSSSEASAPSAAGWNTGHPSTVLDSHALLRGEREVFISHAGQTYRLRHTRNDKLILTK